MTYYKTDKNVSLNNFLFPRAVGLYILLICIVFTHPGPMFDVSTTTLRYSIVGSALKMDPEVGWKKKELVPVGQFSLSLESIQAKSTRGGRHHLTDFA